MMPRKTIVHRSSSGLATCRIPLTFDNRGFPIRWCGQPMIVSASERTVRLDCVEGHVERWVPVLNPLLEWWQGGSQTT